METKTCTICKVTYSDIDANFSKCKKVKCGYQSECKTCWNKRAKEYKKRKIEENKEEFLAKNRENAKKWYHKNKNNFSKELKNERKEYLKNYYEENKERITKIKKAYTEKHKDFISKYQKEYRKLNEDRLRKLNCIRGQKRRAKFRKLPRDLTVDQWEQIKTDFDYCCAYCGMTEEEHYKIYSTQLHQDHFIALSKGGEYTHNNIIPACISCNSSKNNKDFFEWYPEQTFYSKAREKKILKYLNYTKNGEQQLTIAI